VNYKYLKCVHVFVTLIREPGSSVSIVSSYWVDDRAIEVRSSAEAKDFSSSLCIQTASGAHPVFCTMGTGDPFPKAKAWPGSDVDHLPHLGSTSRMSRSYNSSPPSAFVACSGTALYMYTLILIIETEPVSETLPFQSASARLIDRENFIAFIRRESLETDM
jgi:hypothetical protein